MGRMIPTWPVCTSATMTTTHCAWIIDVSLSHEPSLSLKRVISPNPGTVPASFHFVEMFADLANHTMKVLLARMPKKARFKRQLGTGITSWNHPHLAHLQGPSGKFCSVSVSSPVKTVLAILTSHICGENEMMCL